MLALLCLTQADFISICSVYPLTVHLKYGII